MSDNKAKGKLENEVISRSSASDERNSTVGQPKEGGIWQAIALIVGLGAFVFVAGWAVKKYMRESGENSPSSPVQKSAVPGAGASSASIAHVDAQTTNHVNEAALVDSINRANQLLNQGQSAQAIELLTSAMQSKPDDEDVHYNLGIALAKVGRNEEAIKQYEEALRLFPDYGEAHNNLGNLFLRLGKREEALQHLQEATKITPDSASAWNNLGNTLQQLGRTNEASTNFQKAVSLDTNYWQARFNLASSYFQQQRFSEAQSEFEAVLRLYPDFAPAKSALARLSSLTNQLGPVFDRTIAPGSAESK